MVPSLTCLSCGACCAAFRVAFHWSEAAPELGGLVPPDRVEPVDHHRVCMKGTRFHGGRCESLNGQIGVAVSCAIYGMRPSPCQEFGDEISRCDQARAAHGLPPLRPEDLLPPPEPAPQTPPALLPGLAALNKRRPRTTYR